jgi:hypothetical protein
MDGQPISTAHRSALSRLSARPRPTHLEVTADEQEVDLGPVLALGPGERGVDRVELAVAAAFDGDLGERATRMLVSGYIHTLSAILYVGRTCMLGQIECWLWGLPGCPRVLYRRRWRTCSKRAGADGLLAAARGHLDSV